MSAAWEALRADVLHGVDGLDNDQVNIVLDLIDYHTPAEPQGDEALPPLPAPSPTHYREVGLTTQRMEMYTADQMADYIRADRAQRADTLIDIIRGALVDDVVKYHSPEWVARARAAVDGAPVQQPAIVVGETVVSVCGVDYQVDGPCVRITGIRLPRDQQDNGRAIRTMPFSAAPVAAPVAGQEPMLWLEAEESARDQDPRTVFGKDSMMYSTRICFEKPTGKNPAWPLYLEAPAPAASAPTLFDRKLADLEQRGYQVFGRILHKEGQYALFDGSCRWLSKPQYQRLMHEQDGSLFATHPASVAQDPPGPANVGMGEFFAFGPTNVARVGNADAQAACWCETCRPVTMWDSRMVLCPTCGNKRCPRANDHRHECTGSNEPGQPGSSFPSTDAAQVTAAKNGGAA